MADADAARELALYTANTSSLWGPGNTQGAAIRKNLELKAAKGTLDPSKAPKLFEHLMESAAKEYVREMGSPGDRWSDMFNKSTRRLAAEEMSAEYLEELGFQPNGSAAMSKLDIRGRRWRDSSGNTYHTVSIILDLVDGSVEELVLDTPTYGYGDMYMQTALDMLVQEGVVPPPPRHSMSAAKYLRDDLGISLRYSAEDVKRKKDL